MANKIYLVDELTDKKYELPETREVIVGKGLFKRASENITLSGRGCVEVESPSGSPSDVLAKAKWESVAKHHCVLTRHDLGQEVEEDERMLSVRDHMGGAEFRVGGSASISNYGGDGDVLKLGRYELLVRVDR